eukprot:tig00020675_g12600.t1
MLTRLGFLASIARLAGDVVPDGFTRVAESLHLSMSPCWTLLDPASPPWDAALRDSDNGSLSARASEPHKAFWAVLFWAGVVGAALWAARGLALFAFRSIPFLRRKTNGALPTALQFPKLDVQAAIFVIPGLTLQAGATIAKGSSVEASVFAVIVLIASLLFVGWSNHLLYRRIEIEKESTFQESRPEDASFGDVFSRANWKRLWDAASPDRVSSSSSGAGAGQSGLRRTWRAFWRYILVPMMVLASALSVLARKMCRGAWLDKKPGAGNAKAPAGVAVGPEASAPLHRYRISQFSTLYEACAYARFGFLGCTVDYLKTFLSIFVIGFCSALPWTDSLLKGQIGTLIALCCLHSLYLVASTPYIDRFENAMQLIVGGFELAIFALLAAVQNGRSRASVEGALTGLSVAAAFLLLVDHIKNVLEMLSAILEAVALVEKAPRILRGRRRPRRKAQAPAPAVPSKAEAACAAADADEANSKGESPASGLVRDSQGRPVHVEVFM